MISDSYSKTEIHLPYRGVAPSTFHYLKFVSVIPYLFWFVYRPFWQLKEHHPGVDTGSFAWTNQPLLLGITGSNRQIQALEKGTCTSSILATISLLHSNTLTGMRKIQELTSKNWEPKTSAHAFWTIWTYPCPDHCQLTLGMGLVIASKIWLSAVVKVSHKWCVLRRFI